MACLRFVSEPLTKDQFWAAQEEAQEALQRQATSTKRSLPSRDGPPPAKRRKGTDEPTFHPKDFTVPFASQKTVQEWYAKFPAIAKRNFYLVQKHHATANHYDLRIQLDGKTTSFAIPKGLSHWTKGQKRQAFETNPHPISYSLFEGGGIGHTLVYDLGSYKIVPSTRTKQAEEAKKADLASRGFLLEETDEEAESEEEKEELPEDVKQENLFRDAWKRGCFITKPDEHPDRSRSFVIELHGFRYQGLRLTFSRDATDYKETRPRGTPKGQHLLVRSNRWLLQINSREGSAGRENPDIGDCSILTGRTIEEIKEESSGQRGLPASYLKGFEGDLNMEDPPPDDDEALRRLLRVGGSVAGPSAGHRLGGGLDFLGALAPPPSYESLLAQFDDGGGVWQEDWQSQAQGGPSRAGPQIDADGFPIYDPAAFV